MLLRRAPERSTSLLMKARVAAMSSETGSMSVDVSLCTMAGSFIVACTMAFAFSWMSRGVPFGAQIPYQELKI